MPCSSRSSSSSSSSLRIPLPSPDTALLVKRVIDVDKPLRPRELTRDLTLEGPVLVAFVLLSSSSCLLPLSSELTLAPTRLARSSFRAASVAQARVALDHFLSDVELVVQTLDRFAPADSAAAPGSKEPRADAPSLEVGLEGSWEGVR